MDAASNTHESGDSLSTSHIERDGEKRTLRFLAQEHSAEDGGIEIDILCPECRELIQGSYLSMLRCPHCETLIAVDQEDGEILFHQQGEDVCSDCGESSPRIVVDCMQNSIQKFARNVDDFFCRLLK